MATVNIMTEPFISVLKQDAQDLMEAVVKRDSTPRRDRRDKAYKDTNKVVEDINLRIASHIYAEYAKVLNDMGYTLKQKTQRSTDGVTNYSIYVFMDGEQEFTFNADINHGFERGWPADYIPKFRARIWAQPPDGFVGGSNLGSIDFDDTDVAKKWIGEMKAIGDKERHILSNENAIMSSLHKKIADAGCDSRFTPTPFSRIDTQWNHYESNSRAKLDIQYNKEKFNTPMYGQQQSYTVPDDYVRSSYHVGIDIEANVKSADELAAFTKAIDDAITKHTDMRKPEKQKLSAGKGKTSLLTVGIVLGILGLVGYTLMRRK